MAFSSNSYQQLGFADRTLVMSAAQKKALEKSWAGYFSSEIFPRIDERKFSVLYSKESAKPSGPVNVTVGALIIEQIMGFSDEEMVDALTNDLRYQFALRTTSEVVQPLSVRTLQRFRKRCADEMDHSGNDILRQCLEEFYGSIDELMSRFFPRKNMDAAQIIDGVCRCRTGGRFRYEIVADPEIFKENCLPAHSDHVTYASEKEARAAALAEEKIARSAGRIADEYSTLHSNGRVINESGKAGGGKSLAMTQLPEEGEGAALTGSSLRYSLNGIWKFSYAKNYASSIPGFEKTSYDCSGWDDIRVPAHMQMEGYDKPAYINVQYPWEGREEVRPGQIPVQFNPVGSYVKCFRVPEDMKGRPLCISFQGVESGFALWLNGWYVGYSEDSFTPSEFDLTPYLVEGENKLAVQVFKWTASSWLEDQDFFRFSGIFRDVYLYTVPKVHLQDLKIRTLVDESMESARLNMTLSFVTDEEPAAPIGAASSGSAEEEEQDKPLPGKTYYRLERNGKTVLQGDISNAKKIEISEQVFNPVLWSAEAPALYDLYLILKDENGTETEAVHELVGFRRFEMKNGLMCLNGKRIVFKGVNRHEFTAEKGRAAMPLSVMLQDLVTMKRNNINAIRTCHYPDDSRLYRLCDRLGLYMIAENNMESHGSWEPILRGLADRSAAIPGENREWQALLLDRVDSCYERDKNHPAILIWSCGNESFGGSVIYEMSRRFRTLDPDRLVHYEGVFNDRSYNATSDMESQMYPSPDAIRAFLRENPDKPMICCEYTHSMGNSNGDMFKYTDLTDEEPRYQGGFIWDYVDQSLRERDRYGRVYQAYGGDHLERPTDYSFSGNGIVAGDRTPYPKMQDVKFNYQNISAIVSRDQVLVINKNLFVNTGDFDCVCELYKDGTLMSSEVIPAACAPLTQKAFALPFTGEYPAGEYTIIVSFRLKEDTSWAEKGHEVAFGQYVYCVEGDASASENSADAAAGQAKAHYQIIRDYHNVGVKGENFDALISILNGGGLKSYRYAGRELIEVEPRPNFWRALTDNDKGNRMGARYGQWKLASLYADMAPADLDYKKVLAGDPDALAVAMKAREYPVQAEEDGCLVWKMRYFLPTVPVSDCIVTYKIAADGTITFMLDYVPVAGLSAMPEFGFLFRLPADFDRVTWYGNGPEECYCDRERGAKLGIYGTTTEENMTRYLVPQECGNRTGVRWAKVTDEKGRGVLFTAGSGTRVCGMEEAEYVPCTMNFSALPYTPEEIENAAHYTELPESSHTVVRCSLMQMGVGGDDSWGARTHEEFLLPTDKPLHFEVSIKGI